jgi:hypothetical protein
VTYVSGVKEVGMANTSEIQSIALSRRTIVTRSVASAAGAAVLFGLVTEAAAKMSQKSVDYQDTPKNDQECSNCSLFQEPNCCTLVDGEISPKGWCKFWVKKAG